MLLAENYLSYLKLLMVINVLILLPATLLFTQTSMKYIEKKLREQNTCTPWWDQKGWGFRVSTFITLVARGKPAKYPVLADEEILKYVRPYDRVLSIIIIITFSLIVLFGGFLYLVSES